MRVGACKLCFNAKILINVFELKLIYHTYKMLKAVQHDKKLNIFCSFINNKRNFDRQ